MKLQHLHYFIAVAEELHFGRAAKRLNMSQPPLSQQVRLLEEELGVKLLERSTRRVVLTPAGVAFRDDLWQVLAGLDRAVRRVRDIEAGEEGRLSVGYIARVHATEYPHIVKTFRSRFPRVKLVFREEFSFEQLRMLQMGKLDIGCVKLMERPPAEFECLQLAERDMNLIVALSEEHPLAAKETVSLKDLAGEPMIAMPRRLHPEYYDALINAFRGVGVEPVIAQEAERALMELELVASGIGFGIRFAGYPVVQHEGVVFRPVLEESRGLQPWFVWSKDNQRPEVLNFLDVIHEHLERDGRGASPS